MPIDDLLLQSLQLLGLGMGAVCIILVLLIGIVTLISKLVPGEFAVAEFTPLPLDKTAEHHVVAIQAAVHQYRRTHQII